MPDIITATTVTVISVRACVIKLFDLYSNSTLTGIKIMAHLIENMAYVGETPWHGLGNPLTQNQPIEVWAQQAGMDWRIESSNVSYMAKNDRGQSIIMPYEEQRVLYRSDTHAPLGSKNTQIQLINFWPNMELDEYINLEAKVSGRMVLLDISATGEENVIDPNNIEMNDLEYRKKQLQQLKDAVVDLEDMAGGISLTDLTLNDFRLDLSNCLNTPDNLQKLEAMPFGLFSAVSTQQFKDSYDIPKGIIFCLKSLKTGKDALQISDHYPLHPYFLMHVSFDLDIVHQYTQLKQILDIFKLASLAKVQIDQKAYQQVNLMTKQGQDTTLFKKMLVKAIESIEGKNEEKGIESLFHQGGTVLSASGSQNLEDFTVISYLVITD